MLEGVDIVAPGELGDVLVRNLNLRVERGEHLMISGPVRRAYPALLLSIDGRDLERRG